VSKFAYCASKPHPRLTRGLAKELAPYVSVNALSGSIETRLTQALITAHREQLRRRFRSPDRHAEDIAVWCLPGHGRPNFITGEVVDVDGGQWIN
jgi:NAD(P)-dependent dehydrogenase (short-subunit alcohol dehydrogenase family)